MQNLQVKAKKSDTVWFTKKETPHIVSQNNKGYLYREMNIDRRIEERLDVGQGIYAVIDSFAPQICQIKNMGEGGLSYVYFAEEKHDIESETMDILVTGFGFPLERIAFRKVDDFRDEEEQNGRFEKRVACVEFVNLSDEQINQIRYFMAHYVGKTVN
jgi:hypothetical protein